MYKKDWEEMKECKGWLTSHGEKAHCKFCKSDLRPHLADLKKHGATQKHFELTRIREGTSKSVFDKFQENFALSEALQAKKFELQVNFVES